MAHFASLTQSHCSAITCAVIQRLGSGGFLIGSHRSMDAAPIVVGGDPVAAEVTTTAGLDDGAHSLCAYVCSAGRSHLQAHYGVAGTVELRSSLMWTEALLAWTAQVGDRVKWWFFVLPQLYQPWP